MSHELSCGFTDSLEEGVLLLVWKLRPEELRDPPESHSPVGSRGVSEGNGPGLGARAALLTTGVS